MKRLDFYNVFYIRVLFGSNLGRCLVFLMKGPSKSLYGKTEVGPLNGPRQLHSNTLHDLSYSGPPTCERVTSQRTVRKLKEFKMLVPFFALEFDSSLSLNFFFFEMQLPFNMC